MDSRDMQVIGLCRFSYLGEGGFQVEHETLDERAAFLYDPVRMDERFRTLEAFTLPSIRAQTDPNFTFVVLIGETFPEVYRKRLEDLLADIPQAVIQARSPGRHREVMRATINSVRTDSKDPCLQFRLDDDDAVSVRFVERLRDVAQDCRPLIRHHANVAFDFNQGWIARPGATGIDALKVTEALWTPALAMSVKHKDDTTIMNFGHSRMGHVMPVVTMPNENMFIRGHNDFNDSRQVGHVRQFKLSAINLKTERLFRQEFNVDVDRVQTLFAD